MSNPLIFSNVIVNEIFWHLGKNPQDISFYYQKEYNLYGKYLGKICPIHMREKCDCDTGNFMHCFTPFSIKSVMLKNGLKIKTIILHDIHRRVKCVKFTDGICFKCVKTKKLFYLFINDDKYLELKIIN